MSADPRDAILLQHAPLVPVPRYGALPELAMNAHRFLVSAHSVHLEVKRPWLHVCLDLLEHDAEFPMALPYGEIVDYAYEVSFDWHAGAFPLIGRFIDEAAKASPAEHAAWLVWNAETQALEYAPLVAISASAGGISYHRPQLAEHLSLAIDLHSHGAMAAFFSGTDDADDLGAVKFAGVVGELDQDVPGWAFRLCALGLFRELELETLYRCRRCGADEAMAAELDLGWTRLDLCSGCA